MDGETGEVGRGQERRAFQSGKQNIGASYQRRLNSLESSQAWIQDRILSINSKRFHLGKEEDWVETGAIRFLVS